MFALILTNLVGPYPYFAFRAIQIKKEMRALLATLPDNQLHLIILTKEEFSRARVEENEMKVSDKMFDIARTQEFNGLVHVYGVYDEDEDNLLSFLNAVLTNLQKDVAQAPPSFALFTILNSLPAYFEIDFSWQLQDKVHFTYYSELPYSFVPSIDSPPPRRLPG